ncbi:MAG TPA: 2-oxo-4-hydroxy-4-carboxy-5-ureidoimidazoline decarboxylase [Chthoniobacterales bacterium]|jgi:OHCU decarboxylase|nr:2-oxo-4-hydroxy-4-carboxy-5-ureidoimidazoline decarboxylase [Chthoniobacterales bacterium]
MPKLAELNAMERVEFVRVVGPIFEHSPWVAARTASQRPFPSREALHAALLAAVEKASDEEKVCLIRAHPDLIGDDKLTAASKSEQASAGLQHATPDEAKQFREYNRQYRERFGFPFVICARLNKKEAIARAFPVRLRNSREQEIEIALQEIHKIAELRLKDLVE